MLLATVACAPVSTPPPGAVIAGVPQVGATLTASPGVWSNQPTSFVYSWERCADAATTVCTAVGSASSYGVVAADLGQWIGLTVRAVNAFGQGQTRAGSVGPITGAGTTTPTFDVSSGASIPLKAGEAVELQLTAPTGGGSWTVVGGALPDGLTLSAQGVLAGTPAGGGLWAADVAVDSGVALRAAVTAPFHLWGWVSVPRANSAFPPVETFNAPTAPVYVTGGGGEDYCAEGCAWTINPDGTVTDSWFIPLLGPTLGPVDNKVGRDGVGVSSGVLVLPASASRCTVTVADLTQGPSLPLPELATVSTTLSTATRCDYLFTKTLLFITPIDAGQSGPHSADVFDLRTGTLVRASVPLPPGQDFAWPDFDGDAAVILSFNAGTVGVSTIGRNPSDDTQPPGALNCGGGYVSPYTKTSGTLGLLTSCPDGTSGIMATIDVATGQVQDVGSYPLEGFDDIASPPRAGAMDDASGAILNSDFYEEGVLGATIWIQGGVAGARHPMVRLDRCIVECLTPYPEGYGGFHLGDAYFSAP